MSKQFKEHCNCSPKSSFGTCKVCSRIKIVILTKGRTNKNLYYYNYYSKNNKDDNTIITDMWKRIKELPAVRNVASLIFSITVYDNYTDSSIKQVQF